MTEAQRIIDSMSPAELVLYRRLGGVLPRQLAAIADAHTEPFYDPSLVVLIRREGIPSTFVQKRIAQVAPAEPKKVNRERRNARKRQKRALERLRRRIAA